MGQKINPIGLRLGINKTWDSRWYSGKSYGSLLQEDLKIRTYVFENMSQAGISKVVIERPAKKARINIYTARPGVLIGKKGADLDKLKDRLSKFTKSEVSLNVIEVRKPELDAKIVADAVAQQIERRVSFRRAMKRAQQTAMRLGAQGIRINCGGRLGGAEIARTEWYIEGSVPLHTLRSDIDYAIARASTTYGIIGIKVWIYKGQILEHDPMAHERRANDQGNERSSDRGGERSADRAHKNPHPSRAG